MLRCPDFESVLRISPAAVGIRRCFDEQRCSQIPLFLLRTFEGSAYVNQTSIDVILSASIRELMANVRVVGALALLRLRPGLSSVWKCISTWAFVGRNAPPSIEGVYVIATDLPSMLQCTPWSLSIRSEGKEQRRGGYKSTQDRFGPQTISTSIGFSCTATLHRQVYTKASFLVVCSASALDPTSPHSSSVD